MKRRVLIFSLSSLLFLCIISIICLNTSKKTIDFKDNLDKYVVNNLASKKEMIPEYRDGFNILQLTDMHWGITSQIGDDSYGQVRYLKKVVNEAIKHTGKIDLIEVTGDTFMFSKKRTIKSFINVMEEIGIPYAILWGNHDRQGIYNPNWIIKEFLEAKHCLYVEVENDNVWGTGNYVINLEKDGMVKWQIFNLDSGASFREGATDIGLSYDYIRESQLDLLSSLHIKDVPSLAYYHIAQIDQEEAFNFYLSGVPRFKAKFFKQESFCTPTNKDALRMDSIFYKNNIKGAFVGHAHNNDITVESANGIVYGFGVKTGTELYYATIKQSELVEGVNVFDKESFLDFDEDFNLVGASLVTLHDDGNFDLEHLYYNERVNEDFIKWVKY